MLKRNIKLVFSTNALMLSSGVVTSLLSAWALGPDGRGDLTVALTWPGIFAMASEFGLPTAYRYWTAKEPERVSALYSNAIVMTLLIGAVSLAVAWVVIPSLAGNRHSDILYLAQIYAVVIPMTLLTDFIRGLLEGARRFQWVAALRLVFFGFQAVSYVTLWFMHRLTVRAAVYTMIGSAAISLLVALIAIYVQLKPRWRPGWSDLRTTLNYGLREYPGVLTEFINWRLDLLMLVGMASSLQVGLYTVAVKISDITTLLASSVNDALMPEVAASKQADEATKIVTRSLRLTLSAHLLILVPLWIAIPYILKFTYGAGFVPVTNVLRLLMIASVIWSCGAIIISGLNGLGHPGLSTVARVAAAAVMVVALLFSLPRWGIVGAALSSITGYSVMLCVAMFWFLRQRKITLWECMRPRVEDLPEAFTRARLQEDLYRLINRNNKTKSQPSDAVIGSIEDLRQNEAPL